MIDPTTDQPAAVPKIPTIIRREARIICPNCRMENPVDPSGEKSQINCGFCRAKISFTAFPRLTEEPKPVSTGDIAGDEDATCQFFPELKAEIICDECGCFMSDRAAVNWARRNLCLPCLHNLREKKADSEYRAKLKIWDNRALGFLALLPLTLFTAPAALFLLLRFRKEPRGWIPGSAFRWWLALAFTIVILAGWTALIVVWVAMLTRELS